MATEHRFHPEDIPIDNRLPAIDLPVMRHNPDPRPRANPWRVISAAVGVLLILTSLFLPSSAGERINAIVAGLFIIALSVLAVRWPTVRWFNVVVAVWLVVTSISLGHAGESFASLSAVAAAIVFVLSLVPGPSEALPPRPREAA
jgi:hypothetical protein